MIGRVKGRGIRGTWAIKISFTCAWALRLSVHKFVPDWIIYSNVFTTTNRM